MSVIRKLAKNASRSTIGEAVDSVRVGWNSYSFLLYIGGASAILWGFFGLVGPVAVVATLVFFYYAGEFRKQVSLESKRWGSGR